MGEWDFYCSICGGTLSAISNHGGEDRGFVNPTRYDWLRLFQVIGNSSEKGLDQTFLSGPAMADFDGSVSCEGGDDAAIRNHSEWTDEEGGWLNCSVYTATVDFGHPVVFPFHYSCYHVLCKAVERVNEDISARGPRTSRSVSRLRTDLLYDSMCRVYSLEGFAIPGGWTGLLGDYGELDAQEQFADYGFSRAPFLQDPVRIPEVPSLLADMFVEGEDSGAYSYTKATPLTKLPVEIRLLVLDHLPRQDLRNLVRSGLFGTTIPGRWWRRRITIEMPWLWEVQNIRSDHHQSSAWMRLYMHVGNAAFPLPDEQIQAEIQQFDIEEYERDLAMWQKEKPVASIPLMTAQELVSYLSNERSRGLASEGSDEANGDAKHDHNSDDLTTSQDASKRANSLKQIPGIANRRRIWDLCYAHLAPTYLAAERAAQRSGQKAAPMDMVQVAMLPGEAMKDPPQATQIQGETLFIEDADDIDLKKVQMGCVVNTSEGTNSDSKFWPIRSIVTQMLPGPQGVTVSGNSEAGLEIEDRTFGFVSKQRGLRGNFVSADVSDLKGFEIRALYPSDDEKGIGGICDLRPLLFSQRETSETSWLSARTWSHKPPEAARTLKITADRWSYVIGITWEQAKVGENDSRLMRLGLVTIPRHSLEGRLA